MNLLLVEMIIVAVIAIPAILGGILYLLYRKREYSEKFYKMPFSSIVILSGTAFISLLFTIFEIIWLVMLLGGKV